MNPAKSGLLKNRISELFSDILTEFELAGSGQDSFQFQSNQQEIILGSIEIPLPDNSEIENASIATLPMQSFQMEIDAPAIQADKAFRNSPDLIGVIVQEREKIHGIVSRRKFYETMGKPFGIAIFLHRPIHVLLAQFQAETVTVSSRSLITETVHLALDRSIDQIYEPILVACAGKEYKLLDVYTLLLAQMRLFTMLSERVQGINQQLEQRVRTRTAELQHENAVRRRAETMLETRLSYEKTLSLCGNVLLSGADHDDTVEQTMCHLIEAVKVSRIFFLERAELEEQGTGMRLRHQVNAESVSVPSDSSRFFSDAMWGNWFTPLWQGQPVIGQSDQAQPQARKLLRQVGITSVLLIPVGETGNWLGAIGFGETEKQRAWDENDLQLLHTIAQMLFAYLERRKNAQALSQARDEALRASQFKSDLLAKISHELRTPLGAVLGYAQLLRQGSYGEMMSDQKDAMDVVISSTKYLSTLVNGLLDQAHLDSGKLTLTNRPFEIRQMAADVETRIRVLAESKGLFFQVGFGHHLPERMMGDKMRLEQVLINLLGNAVKFTDAGKISMQFEITGENNLAIEISDTGAGISAEAQEQIFAPFIQVDGALTHQHGGTGLGLSISKQLVTMMHGQIKLKSEPGLGSIFTVELPYQPVE